MCSAFSYAHSPQFMMSAQLRLYNNSGARDPTWLGDGGAIRTNARETRRTYHFLLFLGERPKCFWFERGLVSAALSMARLTAFEVGQIKAHAYHDLGPTAISKLAQKPDGEYVSKQSVVDVLAKLEAAERVDPVDRFITSRGLLFFYTWTVCTIEKYNIYI